VTFVQYSQLSPCGHLHQRVTESVIIDTDSGDLLRFEKNSQFDPGFYVTINFFIRAPYCCETDPELFEKWRLVVSYILSIHVIVSYVTKLIILVTVLSHIVFH